MRNTPHKSVDRNEGEGSRTAAHHYEAGVKQTIASGQVDKLADQAKEALDGPQGDELRRAEKAGKKPLQNSYTS